MKIAIVNNNLASGGAEKLIYDMALEFQKRKIDFDIILTTKVNGVYDDELLQKGVKIIYLNSKNKIYSFFNIFKYIKILKNYDVVHVHVFPAQYWVAIASLFLSRKIKFITTEHSTTNRRRNIKIFKLIDKVIYSRYQNIISITNKVRDNLSNWIGYKEKIKIIENGVNLKKIFDTPKIDLNIFSKESKILLMVSRFEEAKDHKTPVKSLKYLPKEYKLLLAGEGKLKVEIEELVKKENLIDRIKFLGYRKDIPELLKYSDLIIQSSNWEGLSLAMIEAMASGTPIIGSKVQGVIDLIDEEELLFEKGNEKELAKKIEVLLNNKELYKKMGNYLIEKSKNYSIEKMVDKYLRIYEE